MIQNTQNPQSVPAFKPLFDLNQKVNVGSWFNNCGLNVITHHFVNALESGVLDVHWQEPIYVKWFSLFKDKYHLPNDYHLNDLKDLLKSAEFSSKNIQEILLAPVFRALLPEALSQNVEYAIGKKGDIGGALLRFAKEEELEDCDFDYLNCDVEFAHYIKECLITFRDKQSGSIDSDQKEFQFCDFMLEKNKDKIDGLYQSYLNRLATLEYYMFSSSDEIMNLARKLGFSMQLFSKEAYDLNKLKIKDFEYVKATDIMTISFDAKQSKLLNVKEGDSFVFNINKRPHHLKIISYNLKENVLVVSNKDTGYDFEKEDYLEKDTCITLIAASDIGSPEQGQLNLHLPPIKIITNGSHWEFEAHSESETNKHVKRSESNSSIQRFAAAIWRKVSEMQDDEHDRDSISSALDETLKQFDLYIGTILMGLKSHSPLPEMGPLAAALDKLLEESEESMSNESVPDKIEFTLNSDSEFVCSDSDELSNDVNVVDLVLLKDDKPTTVLFTVYDCSVDFNRDFDDDLKDFYFIRSLKSSRKKEEYILQSKTQASLILHEGGINLHADLSLIQKPNPNADNKLCRAMTYEFLIHPDEDINRLEDALKVLSGFILGFSLMVGFKQAQVNLDIQNDRFALDSLEKYVEKEFSIFASSLVQREGGAIYSNDLPKLVSLSNQHKRRKHDTEDTYLPQFKKIKQDGKIIEVPNASSMTMSRNSPK